MILFNATSSRRKWYLVQMCLVFDDSAVVPEELRCCPRTSAQKKTGETLIRSTNQTDTSYTASWLAFASPIYSDSHDESATIGCFFELHVTGPPANMYK